MGAGVAHSADHSLDAPVPEAAGDQDALAAGEEPGGAKMYVMLWNQIGKNELVFRQEYTKYIVSYEAPGNRFVTFGEPHGLPEKLTATLNTGETLEVIEE